RLLLRRLLGRALLGAGLLLCPGLLLHRLLGGALLLLQRRLAGGPGLGDLLLCPLRRLADGLLRLPGGLADRFTDTLCDPLARVLLVLLVALRPGRSPPVRADQSETSTHIGLA